MPLLQYFEEQDPIKKKQGQKEIMKLNLSTPNWNNEEEKEETDRPKNRHEKSTERL